MYIEDLHQDQAKGRNSELEDFISLVPDEDGLGDEETTALDGEDATPDSEGDEVVACEESNDEDLDI